MSIALVVALVGGTVLTGPALAAPAAASLTVDKKVDGKDAITVGTGDEFTYSILVGCDDSDCVDAKLVDPLPAQFAGFDILESSVTPSSQPATKTLDGCSTTVTPDCTLTVLFQQSVAGGVGIAAGGTYRVSVTLKAPQNLAPSWTYNNVVVPNTATATSTTADTKSDSADVTVSIPVTVDGTVGKTWAPANQQFAPGAASTITLTDQNTSNVPASTLTVQDPTAAADGATALDAGNPFALVDFTGFGAVSLPAGADTVQVDAYVFDTATGAWKWQTGPPTAAADIRLPDGVDASAVAGLRFTYAGTTGATIAARGASGSVALMVAQRAENRITGTSLVTGGTVTNKVTGTVAVPGETPVSHTAQAPYTIGALNVVVSAGKTITPSRIPAGTEATAAISGKNDSNGPLTTLTLSDLDYFTETLTFGGFLAPISYPTGATGATVTWHFSNGNTISMPVPAGATPTAPPAPGSSHLTGFVLGYTGSIGIGAVASAQFGIAPLADYVAPEDSPADVVNTLAVQGTNPAGTATTPATAPLKIFSPDISLQLSKKISPTGAVAPGATVVAQLPTTTSTDSAFVKPTKIVVEDVWRPGESADFFNAFNPIAIAPTQVPLGSTMRVEYSTDGGASYVTLATVDATAAAQIYRGDLPAALIGDITGLRFTFEKSDGFAQGTTVSPNFIAQARADLRAGGTPTSVPDAGPTSYENEGKATGTGAVTGAPPVVSKEVDATADASIETHTGDGSLIAAKHWTKPDLTGSLSQLDSQSGEKAGTVLAWGVTDLGYSSVTVTDPSADQDHPENTVFNAFDLTAVAPVTFSAQPLLQWDAVSAVELFENGAWVVLPAPGGSWMSTSGFKGHVLTTAESAATTGVRLTVVPNDAARAASADPLAPSAGSGIATVSSDQTRSFGLVWQLRNVVRVDSSPSHRWVTADRVFNDPEAGSIWNRSSVSGVRNGAGVGPVNAQDEISLVDQPPLVDLVKTSSRQTVVVPKAGDVDAGDYPTNDFTITATNASASRASYIRVTDPAPCDSSSMGDCLSAPDRWTADPFAGKAYANTSPFERLNLTKITFTVPAADQVDTAASQVTLWHRADDGTLSTTVVTMAQAQALAAADLVDVVGVSVVYQGTDPATAGGSIAAGSKLVMKLSTQVRVTLRSAPAQNVTAFAIDNYAFTQGYDPVLVPSGQGSQPNDGANAGLVLSTGALGVKAAKTFSPSTLLERDRHTPVAVTLTATQGTATVPTHQVIVTDDDQAFWNTFALTGLSAGDVTLPAGADQVRVDVQTTGASTWIEGTASAAATLPTTAVGDVTGIRFVFSRADGGLFSRTTVPGDFTAKAVLHLALLDAARDGSAIPFPSTLSDTVTAVSHRTDDPAVYKDASDDATATMALRPGTFALDVAKSPENNVHTVNVGDTNSWTLTFANTGTGYLDVKNLVDTLPASLAWDGETPVFSTTTGGTLSTSPTTAFDAGTGALTLAWPTGAARMSPGEKFTVKLGLVLQPGLTGTDRAVNRFVVNTAQTLAQCTNTSGNGQGTLPGLDSGQCGTSNFVQPISGPSLFTTKGVKGDVVDRTVSGATNTTDPKATCAPDKDGYYVAPCAANTVVGGTDEWRLQAVNSGTVSYDSLVFVEPLPTVGDRMLATGSPRGSTFRPVLDPAAGMTIDAPAGTTSRWQVTTTPDVCVGTGSTTAWPADPTCESVPWTDSTAFSGDWNAVTGVRVILDFTTTTGRVLAPGAAVTVKYRTLDRPVTADAPDGAPVSIAAGPAFAWNQFGATAGLTGGGTVRRAPVKAGVTLLTGPLQIDKVIDGSAAAKAPDEFLADVACTVAGVPVDLGSSAQPVLAKANGLTARIDGIPLGAECTIAEHGDPGSYGEAARSISSGTVRIASVSMAGVVPVDQTVTITNTYEFGRLAISKTAADLTVGVNASVTYTITVTNVGALDATDFAVTDTLPAGATFVSADNAGVENAGVVTWKVTELKRGDQLAVHVTVRYPAAGTFFNKAGVTTPPIGPWSPPEVTGVCSGDADNACSEVVVTPPLDPKDPSDPKSGLAATGSSGDPLGVALAGVLLAMLGAALLLRRRRGQA